MSVKKTGGKTGQFAKGKDPRRGGGKKGRSGRKPLEFVQECSRLTDSHVLPKIEKLLASQAGPDDAAWKWAAEYVSKYSKSAAPARMEHSGTVTLEQILAASRQR